MRAAIIGSGPSLRGVDLRNLKADITICVNDACIHLYRGCDYVFTHDDTDLKNRVDSWREACPEAVITAALPDDYTGDAEIDLVYKRLSWPGISQIPGVIHSDADSGFGALQFALQMGAEKIALLGMDHCHAKSWAYGEGTPSMRHRQLWLEGLKQWEHDSVQDIQAEVFYGSPYGRLPFDNMTPQEAMSCVS